MIATNEEISNVRYNFYNAARAMFPNVGEPGTVWVVTQVLGWDWDKVTRTAVDGFGRESYRVFVLDDKGNRTYDAEHNIRVVTRKWTSEEKRKLKEWWWLLGL